MTVQAPHKGVPYSEGSFSSSNRGLLFAMAVMLTVATGLQIARDRV